MSRDPKMDPQVGDVIGRQDSKGNPVGIQRQVFAVERDRVSYSYHDPDVHRREESVVVHRGLRSWREMFGLVEPWKATATAG